MLMCRPTGRPASASPRSAKLCPLAASQCVASCVSRRTQPPPASPCITEQPVADSRLSAIVRSSRPANRAAKRSRRVCLAPVRESCHVCLRSQTTLVHPPVDRANGRCNLRHRRCVRRHWAHGPDPVSIASYRGSVAGSVAWAPEGSTDGLGSLALGVPPRHCVSDRRSQGLEPSGVVSSISADWKVLAPVKWGGLPFLSAGRARTAHRMSTRVTRCTNRTSPLCNRVDYSPNRHR